MNIVYACNRNYIYPTVVSLYSLLKNGRKERPVRILLLAETDLGYSELQPITELVSRFDGCSISVQWPQKGACRRFAFDDSCCLGGDDVQVACYRLFIPEILRGESRCLYLDCDTLVCGSLEEIYDLDMNKTSLAGVTDRICLEADQVDRLKKDWGIDPGYYINSGVLLMDLDRMRNSGNAERALGLAYNAAFRYMDQDVINQVYRGEIKLLPKCYNVSPDDNTQDYNTFKGLLPEQAGLFYDSAISNPAIIHYAGPDKPWNSSNVPLAQYWQETKKACDEFQRTF